MKSPFPQDWKEYTIGDCLRRVEHPVEVDSDALYTQIGIRSHGKGLFYKEPVTGELLGSKAVYWVEPNCFILNIVFAWEQAIGKTTQAEVGMIGSHRFPMYKPVNNLIDIDYLVYYLLTKRGTDILEAASPGGAGRNRTLGQDRFMKSRIVLPPLDEQQKIAKILSTQDKAIELQGRKIEELERFKKSCLEKMFPRKGQKVPEKRFPGFTDDWEQRKLGEVATFINGRAYSQPELLSSGKYKVLRVGNFYTNDSWYYSDLELGEKYYADYGDLLYTWSATFGPHIWLGDRVIYHYHIWKINLSDQLEKQFAVQLLEQDRANILSSKNGSTMVHITKEGMEQKDVIIPPSTKEQQEIGAFFLQLDHLITLHQRKLEEMKKQKKALMQLLLTGIVRVRL